MNEYEFDWNKLAFDSKKPLTSLHAIFIGAPREISPQRLTQLIKANLPLAPIIIGIAKEAYIDGFDGQPQFKTLQLASVQSIIDKVNRSASEHKIFTLSYFQRDLTYILEKIKPQSAVFINGSWHNSFHTLPAYFILVNQHVPYQLVSPFCDETEACAYETAISKQILPIVVPSTDLTDGQIMEVVDLIATHSFESSFQIGAVLAKKTAGGYRYLTSAFNRVLPYQTYAMQHGASRETYFSPPNDLNHYDTIHAEMELLVKAQKNNIDLSDTTLFINLMPCPNCARTLSATDIAEYVYRSDHSEGYAAQLFEKSGRTVRRLV